MTFAKGKLIPIGGAESKGLLKNQEEIDYDFFTSGILKSVLEENKYPDPHIAVITSGSNDQEEMAAKYFESFKKLGCTNIHILNIKDISEADSKINLNLARIAQVIYMTGGDQSKLVSRIGDSEFFQIIRSRYLVEENFIIAGTSAGAAAMPEKMIVSGSPSEALIKGNMKMENGLNLSDGIIIDTHFVQRGRFARLVEALLENRSTIGLGLGEDTAVVIEEGIFLKTIGSGLVMVLDTSETTYTNFEELKQGETICLENLKVTVLTKGTSYNLIDKNIVKPSVLKMK